MEERLRTQERYFLVIRCLRDNDDRVVVLSTPPNLDICALGQVRQDSSCIRHIGDGGGIGKMVFSKGHGSKSILISLDGFGNLVDDKAAALEKARSLFESVEQKLSDKKVRRVYS